MLNKKRLTNFLFTFIIINSAIYYLQGLDMTRILVTGSLIWIAIFISSVVLAEDEEFCFAYPALFIPVFTMMFMIFGIFAFSPLLFVVLENVLIFIQVPFCFTVFVKEPTNLGGLVENEKQK